MFNQEILTNLFEGQPIYYSQSGNLPGMTHELMLIDSIEETEILPLSKMGKAFKKKFQSLTNILHNAI